MAAYENCYMTFILLPPAQYTCHVSPLSFFFPGPTRDDFVVRAQNIGKLGLMNVKQIKLLIG